MQSAVPLAQIRIDGGTQPRSKIDEAVVAEYASAMEGGATFPPIAIFFDGVDNWLADGFHRYHAARQIRAETIAASKHTGTKRDAILYSLQANIAHGKQITVEDKKRAAIIMLQDPEWVHWSDTEIANHCGWRQQRIGEIRKSLTGTVSEKTFTNKHGSVSTMRTENIGKRPTRDGELMSALHKNAIRTGLREGQESKETRVAQITELAAAGNVAAQIGDKLGVSEGRVRLLANEHGIKLVDHQLGKRHRINNRRVLEETVLGLEASAASLRTLGISLTGIDPTEAADWAQSIGESLRAFTSLRKKLQEHANGKA